MSSPLAPTEGWRLRNWFWPSGSTTSTGTGTGSSVALQGVSALRATIPAAEFEIRTLLYLNAPNDGAGGDFAFQPLDTNLDDGIDYIIPNSITRPTTGTWVRMQT